MEVGDKLNPQRSYRKSFALNAILDGVRAHPILDKGLGKKAPRVNSAI